MKYFTYLFLTLFASSLTAQSHLLDKLVDLGGYKMHFKIIRGTGTPILFESGAGDDGSIWKDIAASIHKVTGTTIITYSRAGFGKSQINPNHHSNEQHGILNGVLELETALQKLGYFEKIILVSHSYGGFYTTLFTARNPEKVLYNVRVDANLAGQYTDDILIKAEADNQVEEMKDQHLGHYYLGINFANTVRLMRQTIYPDQVPAIDIVSPIRRHHTEEEWILLQKTHQDFVDAQPNRTGIIAHGSGHYIFIDNPGLVINAIIKAYTETLSDKVEKLEILTKALEHNMELFIAVKQQPTE